MDGSLCVAVTGQNGVGAWRTARGDGPDEWVHDDGSLYQVCQQRCGHHLEGGAESWLAEVGSLSSNGYGEHRLAVTPLD